MNITPSGASCGASVTGLDWSNAPSSSDIAACKEALLKHRVLAFPDQRLNDDALESASLEFGPFGDDPFIAPIPGRQHIIAVQRKANEQAPIFAENWHTDWSFQSYPPAATCLYGITIPPMGGDTWFSDQVSAARELPPELRKAIQGKYAIHSAKLPYAPQGVYGESDRATDRSMDIRADVSAEATMLHPLLSPHPQTGEERIFGCIGYIIGIDGMPDDEALDILMRLAEHQTQDAFVYKHRWQREMLVIWDNRSVLHKATGGYEGFDRLLHRTTVSTLEGSSTLVKS